MNRKDTLEAIRKDGMIGSFNPDTGEYRVTFSVIDVHSHEAREAAAYYTSDPKDALDTAKAMREGRGIESGRAPTLLEDINSIIAPNDYAGFFLDEHDDIAGRLGQFSSMSADELAAVAKGQIWPEGTDGEGAPDGWADLKPQYAAFMAEAVAHAADLYRASGADFEAGEGRNYMRDVAFEARAAWALDRSSDPKEAAALAAEIHGLPAQIEADNPTYIIAPEAKAAIEAMAARLPDQDAAPAPSEAETIALYVGDVLASLADLDIDPGLFSAVVKTVETAQADHAANDPETTAHNGRLIDALKHPAPAVMFAGSGEDRDTDRAESHHAMTGEDVRTSFRADAIKATEKAASVAPRPTRPRGFGMDR